MFDSCLIIRLLGLLLFVLETSAKCVPSLFIRSAVASPTAAVSFCSQYLATTSLPIANYPKFATACSSSKSALSDACSLVGVGVSGGSCGHTSSTTSSSTTSATTTTSSTSSSTVTTTTTTTTSFSPTATPTLIAQEFYCPEYHYQMFQDSANTNRLLAIQPLAQTSSTPPAAAIDSSNVAAVCSSFTAYQYAYFSATFPDDSVHVADARLLAGPFAFQYPGFQYRCEIWTRIPCDGTSDRQAQINIGVHNYLTPLANVDFQVEQTYTGSQCHADWINTQITFAPTDGHYYYFDIYLQKAWSEVDLGGATCYNLVTPATTYI